LNRFIDIGFYYQTMAGNIKSNLSVQKIRCSENPLLWLTDLEIRLGIWQGVFEEASSYWLRWCDQEGNWLLTDTEQAQAQLLQAAQNLLATGMEISQVAEILGLSEAQNRRFAREVERKR